jgi:cobalt-zinc-cadmium efflux system membrane fusion protein
MTISTRISRLLAVAAPLVTLAILAACARQPAPPPDDVTVHGDTVTFRRARPGEPSEGEKSLTVAPVQQLRPRTARFPGHLVWNEDRTVRVSSPFAGRVAAIHASPGDRVAAGAPLVTLASPDIGAAQADLAKAEADLALADKALRRARDLQAAGVLAARDREQAESDHAHALAERERARRRLQPYGATAAVDGQFVVRSPLAGVVVERSVNPGQEVRPDQAAPLFVVSDPSTLWLQVELPEDDAAATRVGQTVLVRRETGGVAPRPARVVSVADTVDPVTRSLRTRAVLDNGDRALKAEQFVRVDVTATGNPMPVVPAAAVFLVGDRQFTWVADGKGNYHRREVATAEEGGGEVAIRSGLGAGELVVTSGGLLLQQQAAGGG